MPPKPKPITDRFWDAVSKRDACWLWTGVIGHAGYGRLFVGRVGEGRGRVKWMPAHHFSWRLHNGPIPDGQMVLHACDVPNCVNPAHLFLGTHQDNMADRQEKERQARGASHGLSKLDEVTVHRMRLEWAGGKSFNQLARDTGFSESTVSRAVRGVTWRHVKEA